MATANLKVKLLDSVLISDGVKSVEHEAGEVVEAPSEATKDLWIANGVAEKA